MKRVRINGQEYTAETAVALINEVKGMHWRAGENATAEEYIAVQEDTYQRMTGRRIKLPDTGTEDRAAVMFRRISEIGAWKYEDTDAGKGGA